VRGVVGGGGCEMGDRCFFFFFFGKLVEKHMYDYWKYEGNYTIKEIYKNGTM